MKTRFFAVLFATVLGLCPARAADLTNVSFEDATLDMVLSHIAMRGKIGIVYSKSQLRDAAGDPLRVTIRARKVSPEELLEAVAVATSCELVPVSEELWAVRPPSPGGKQVDVPELLGGLMGLLGGFQFGHGPDAGHSHHYDGHETEVMDDDPGAEHAEDVPGDVPAFPEEPEAPPPPTLRPDHGE